MLLTKINVHVLTISISCRHPHKCVVYCCYSVVQSVLLFHCPVVQSIFPSLSHCPVVQLLSSLLCYSGVQFIVLCYFPVYQGIPLSILLHDNVIVQSMVLFFCLVYCVMLLSSLLCCSVYSTLYCPVYSTLSIAWSIECFYVMSRRPYWCPKTMERQPCWCPKPVLWELSSFLMLTLSFVPINLHRCWPRE